MNTLDRLEKLEEQTSNPTERETIIPKFQTPDTCVFCTDKDYDFILYLVYRLAYEYKTRKSFEKQDKETCIHHTDDWLKHSLMSAQYAYSTFTDYGRKPMNWDEFMELFKNKELREKLLTKEYEECKKYTCAIDLYLPKSSGVNTEKRYNNAFTIEDDIFVQNKIIHNKIKLYYNKAIEVLRNFQD